MSGAYLVFVEYFLIVRHKLLCLLFALNAGALDTEFMRDRVGVRVQ